MRGREGRACPSVDLSACLRIARSVIILIIIILIPSPRLVIRKRLTRLELGAGDGERRERRVAARGPAVDAQAVGVHEALLYQVGGARKHVVHVVHAPPAGEGGGEMRRGKKKEENKG